MTAVNVAYVVAALARSHEDVETFCKDEGMLLLVSPSVHLALVGSALRVARFRTWRRLFVKATLFRLRYQVSHTGGILIKSIIIFASAHKVVVLVFLIW